MKILSNKQYELFLAQQGRIEQLQKENAQLQKENEQLKEKRYTVECNHIFNSYRRMYDCKRMCQTFYLKCAYCGEIVTMNLDSLFLYDLQNDIYDNGIIRGNKNEDIK